MKGHELNARRKKNRIVFLAPHKRRKAAKMPESLSDQAIRDGNPGIGHGFESGGIRISVQFRAKKVDLVLGFRQIPDEREDIGSYTRSTVITPKGIDSNFQKPFLRLFEDKGFNIIALFSRLCYRKRMNSFSELSIDPRLVSALEKRSITVPTPVQKEVIPALLAGENLLFQSETGTGKTFCYLIPALMKCALAAKDQSPVALIVAPTHELGSQIKSEANILAKDAGIDANATLCIGGAPLKRQIDALKEKPAIVVGGPARIVELIRMKKLKVNAIRMVVLDETDRMLAPEMRDMIRELLSILPRDAQYVACSATLSRYHATLVEKMIPERPKVAADGANADDGVDKPTATHTQYRIRMINLPPEDVLKRNITHWALFSEGRDKIETLRKFLIAEHPGKALIFTAIAGQVENIAAQLNFKKVPCSALHAKLDKIGRKKAMDDFRAGRTKVLVTSDLAARGLDIPDVTHVIQLDVNENEDFFVHRAGRTARAGKSGINVVFGDEFEMKNLAKIEKRLGIVIYPKVLYGGAVHTPEQDGEQEL